MAAITLLPLLLDNDNEQSVSDDVLPIPQFSDLSGVASVLSVAGASVLPVVNNSGNPVSDASPSGNPYIDGLLTGMRWSDPTISYSNPDAGGDYLPAYLSDQDGDGVSAQNEGFSMLTPQQMMAAHFALNDISSTHPGAAQAFSIEGFTNLGIEYAGSGRGDATIRLANTYDAWTAYTYYPNPWDSGGDVWLGSSGVSPMAGNYDWFTVLHEIGHGLGLKHGQESGFYGALPGAVDAMEYSVMTYRSYADASPYTGYTNGDWDFAQSYMMLDIAALQYMYGADYTINSGDTVYTWSPGSGTTLIDGIAGIEPGANRIFATLWDGGGNDTYNLSAYTTSVNVDLHPGGASVFSSDQLAQLGFGHVADGNIFNALNWGGDTRSFIENAIGGSGDDTLIGNAVNNMLIGGAGNDVLIGDNGDDLLDGGPGTDSLQGSAGNDKFIYDASDTRIDGGSGTDTLSVSGGGVTTDLTSSAGRTVTGIEIVDLTGSGDNSLVLRFSDVLAIAGTSGTLRIDGNAGDRVTVTDSNGATQLSDQVVGGQTYHTYVAGNATLLVDTDISAGGGTPTPEIGSPNHTRVTDGSSTITDSAGHVWSLEGQIVYVDGASFNGGWGNMLLYEDGVVYHRSPSTGTWYNWDPDALPYPWVDTGTTDPESRLTAADVIFSAPPNDIFGSDSLAQTDTSNTPADNASVQDASAGAGGYESDSTGMASAVIFATLMNTPNPVTQDAPVS